MNENQITILAKFMARNLDPVDTDYENLVEYENLWTKTYQENRAKLSFNDAELLAYKTIINKIIE